MLSDELREIAEALGRAPVGARVLAGGFSHETSLLTLTDGQVVEQVVVRLGGQDPVVEAAVMAVAGRTVPVPEVLAVLNVLTAEARPAMVLAHVAGTPLDRVLDEAGPGLAELGAEVGRTAAAVGSVTFDRPGFFADAGLAVRPEHPWSRQLAPYADECMTKTPDARLDVATRRAWAALCADHAPALTVVDDHACLVHADLNPKNLLVTGTAAGWRVAALLDWEFSYSGSPYADGANMVRFGADYPPEYVAGFRAAFADHLPAELAAVEDWPYLGRVMDMFALSGLVTHPLGQPVADRAAREIRRWVADGVPAD